LIRLGDGGLPGFAAARGRGSALPFRAAASRSPKAECSPPPGRRPDRPRDTGQAGWGKVCSEESVRRRLFLKARVRAR